MNKSNIILFALINLLCFTSCQQNKPVLIGTINGFSEEKIYLYEIKNRRYNKYIKMDSSIIENGSFQFDLKDKKSELFFIGNDKLGGNVFVQSTDMEIDGVLVDGEKIDWQVKGSLLHDLYANYISEKNIINSQKQRDSLTILFYKARAEKNRDEMARVKSESMKFYTDEIYAKSYAHLLKSVNENTNNALGAYLYATGVFPRLSPQTLNDIEEIIEYLKQFGTDAINTSYMKSVNENLDQFSQCAIGAIAPEIIGKDTIGNVINLSHFRGKYVIVDFWSSGCKYCRLETPNLKKTLEKYKDKNFTILGVSSDWKKKAWMKAIHEDESNWDHMKIDKDNISKVMDDYCISGIPHIILLDPAGKILAKDLRGSNIYEIPRKFLN